MVDSLEVVGRDIVTLTGPVQETGIDIAETIGDALILHHRIDEPVIEDVHVGIAAAYSKAQFVPYRYTHCTLHRHHAKVNAHPHLLGDSVGRLHPHLTSQAVSRSEAHTLAECEVLKVRTVERREIAQQMHRVVYGGSVDGGVVVAVVAPLYEGTAHILRSRLHPRQ